MNARIFTLTSSLIAALLTTPIMAGDQLTRSESGIWFDVNSPEPASLPVIHSQTEDPFVYDIFASEIQFSIGSLSGYYDQPLFCFDRDGGTSSAVGLRARDANGNVVIENFGIGSSLQYLLGDPGAIVVSPSSSSYCFYNDSDGQLGLFGKQPVNETEPADRIHGDAFSAFSDIQVSYADLASGVTEGESLTYQLTIANNGNGDAENLAFQEVFPSNGSVFGATLTEGTWECFSSDSSQYCPELSGAGNLRFANLNLPAGKQMTFEISRQVTVNDALPGGFIDLHAAAVDMGGIVPKFGTTESTLEVIGAPAAFKFDVPPSDTELGGTISPAVVVHVVDSNGNLVTSDNSTYAAIRLINDSQFFPELALVQVVDGVATFPELVLDPQQIDGLTDGTHQLRVGDPYSGLPTLQSQDFEILPATP